MKILKNIVTKFLYYDFKFSKVSLFKLFLFLYLSIFIIFIIFLYNKKFIDYLNEYYIVIDNIVLNNIILYISNFVSYLNLTLDSIFFLTIILIVYFIIILLSILSIYKKFFRLPLIYMCSKLLIFYYYFSGNYILNMNKFIIFFGAEIRKKLTIEEKTQLINNLHKKYISNLEPNYYLDKCLNEEVINNLLNNTKNINHPFLLEDIFNNFFRDNTFIFIPTADTNYTIYYVGIIIIGLICCGLYFYIKSNNNPDIIINPNNLDVKGNNNISLSIDQYNELLSRLDKQSKIINGHTARIEYLLDKIAKINKNVDVNTSSIKKLILNLPQYIKDVLNEII